MGNTRKVKLAKKPLRMLPLLCLLLAPVAATGAQSQAGVAVIPSLVEKAALAFAAELRGAVGMQRHFSTTIKAGPVTHSETSESGILFNNGVFVKIKYYRIADDGKAFSAAQIRARESQTNKDWTAGKIFFKEPYDKRYMGRLQFLEAASVLRLPERPRPRESTITSALQDVQHGNGIMWIDSARARVSGIDLHDERASSSDSRPSGTITEVSSNPASEVSGM